MQTDSVSQPREQASGRLKPRFGRVLDWLHNPSNEGNRLQQPVRSNAGVTKRQPRLGHPLRAAAVLALVLGAFAPVRPVLADTPAPTITTPTEGALITKQPVLASGTSVANAFIDVFDGAGRVGGALTDSSGRWTAMLEICSGSHTIRARAIGPDLTMSPFSPPRTFTVDAAPPAPEITAPAANAYLNNASVTLQGTSFSCTTITIRENGVVLAGDLPVTDSVWGVTLPFSEALHTVTATAKEALGRTSAPTPRSFTVDLTAPAAPSITTPAEGAVLPTSTVTVSGTAESSATVRVYEAQALLATTTASSSGSWSVSIASFAGGSHSVTARATDRAGNQGASSTPRTFVVDITPPLVTITTPNGTVFPPADEGRVTGGASDNHAVARIELRWQNVATGQSTTTVAECSGCGTPTATWSGRAPLAPGAYRVEATAVDTAGNRSSPREITIVRL